MYSIDNENIGAYLKELLEKSEYETATEFCKDYLRLQNKSDEIQDEQLKNIRNRFSQIFKGKKSIQIHDLPILTHIFHVSCEEILSAGQIKCNSSHTVTNYGIANSHDRKVWDEYMKRDDRLFLNCDEYRKTVIDYALESKNYDFMKYLLEEGFIWFVDNSEKCSGQLKLGFGAGTKVKSNWDRFDLPDQSIDCELRNNYTLRTQTIALAIENEDFDILESMLARMIPLMHKVDFFGTKGTIFDDEKNDDLIIAVASSDNKNILEYFSDEFIFQNMCKKNITFVFPFIDDVIEIMLSRKKYENAEFVLKKVIKHNKDTFEKLSSLIDNTCNSIFETKQKEKEALMKEAYENGVSLNKLKFKFASKEDIRKEITYFMKYDQTNHVVSIFTGGNSGLVTNIFSINESKGTPIINKLIDELNGWYNKIISLGGEKNAEVLF